MIPGLLVDDFVKNLVSSDGLTLYALIRLQWGGFDSVFPKQTTLAELTGFSLSKVGRLLKELNDTGWILKERQGRIHGNNQYFICDSPFVKPEPSEVTNRLRKIKENA